MRRQNKYLQEIYASSAVLNRLMHTYMHKAFEELGLAPSQIQLLQYIEQRQPVSQKELANHMRLTPGAITQLTEGLVDSGYVQRTTDTTDRRVTNIALTVAGRDKIGALSRKKKNMLAKMVADLNDEELQLFLKVQQKMLAYLETACKQEVKHKVKEETKSL